MPVTDAAVAALRDVFARAALVGALKADLEAAITAVQLAQARTLVPPAAALYPGPGALQTIHGDLAPILQELRAAARYVGALAWAVDQEEPARRLRANPKP